MNDSAILSPCLRPETLAERNEFANAPYVGAKFPDGIAVPKEWCETAPMRAYVVGELRPYRDVVATHETALWVHTGVATLALERSLSFAHLHDSQKPGARREQIPSDHVMVLSGQYLTTPTRTAVDLLLADTESGVEYLAALFRVCPDTSMDSVIQCAWEMRSKQGIGRVRALLGQLSQAQPFAS